ncbi:J domain-containing protein [Flexibacterium corallicola]|uniref:J domain-containing protein n=1 Tax=Flexibacterium corallicola TaxID=3037259 RepID=UPI00286EBE8D|nr:J domain-containing protein [Pseudovibrio sp. M1P-2-3]
MKDPYSVLGVSKSANDKEVKSAFRKLAKKYHPDQNADDPKAKEHFAEVNQAYEILGDKEKRGQFDRGEIDGEGKPKFYGGQGYGGFGQGGPRGGFGYQQGPGSAGGFDDILNDILGGFGGGQRRAGRGFGNTGASGSRQSQKPHPQKGADASIITRVSLEDLVTLGKARVKLPSGKTVDVKVPEGTQEGDKIRLKGQGYGSPNGGAAGDALVEVRFAKHKLFKTEDFDVHADLPITLYEAVLGNKIRVPTLEGAINLTVPANSSSGKTMRLKSKGLPKKGGERGDLYIHLQIALPDQSSEDLEELMRTWAETKQYSPRGSEFD